MPQGVQVDDQLMQSTRIERERERGSYGTVVQGNAIMKLKI